MIKNMEKKHSHMITTKQFAQKGQNKIHYSEVVV